MNVFRMNSASYLHKTSHLRQSFAVMYRDLFSGSQRQQQGGPLPVISRFIRVNSRFTFGHESSWVWLHLRSRPTLKTFPNIIDFHSFLKQWPLWIQICPKGFPLLFWGWDVSTINPLEVWIGFMDPDQTIVDLGFHTHTILVWQIYHRFTYIWVILW